jgi:hypothetical protein
MIKEANIAVQQLSSIKDLLKHIKQAPVKVRKRSEVQTPAQVRRSDQQTPVDNKRKYDPIIVKFK